MSKRILPALSLVLIVISVATALSPVSAATSPVLAAFSADSGVLLTLSPSSSLRQAAAIKPAEIVWTAVPGPGKKCPINDDYYFKYEFSEKPKMGMVILKIQVFDKEKNQVVPYKAIGRSDMPTMRGAHDSGEVEFKLNRKNDYLLPVNVVMPGEWEIQVVFQLNDQPIYHGSIRFDV